MRNLAGDTNADIYCTQELTLAGIDVVILDKPQSREVSTRVTGHLHTWNVNIKLEREWYYWVAKGLVPLTVAERMYEDEIGKRDVRVAGHCGRPPPSEWAEAYRRVDGVMRLVCVDPEGIQEEECKRLGDRLNVRFNNIDFAKSVDGLERYVESYHIDSQEGLNLFANMLREYRTFG